MDKQKMVTHCIDSGCYCHEWMSAYYRDLSCAVWMTGWHSEEIVYQEVTTDTCHTAQEIRLWLGKVSAAEFVLLKSGTAPLRLLFSIVGIDIPWLLFQLEVAVDREQSHVSASLCCGSSYFCISDVICLWWCIIFVGSVPLNLMTTLSFRGSWIWCRIRFKALLDLKVCNDIYIWQV